MYAIRTILAAGALLATVAGGAANAQSPLLNRVVQSGWIQCSIVGGRVTFEGARFGNMQSTTRNAQPAETLKIRVENGQLALDYTRTMPDQQLTIEIAGSGNRMVMRRMPRGKSSVVPIEFRQIANEKTTLTLGSGSKQRVFRARGIWQLLIAHPKECQQHLLPLLDMLRPNWNLAETAANVEEKLLLEANRDGTAQRARWAALVAQLADPRFGRREAADRALRAEGAKAAAYLRQLDFNSLDTEQQFRVHRIIDAQANHGGDDPVEQIAATLASDPAVWLGLLARPELATRRTAARQLTTLLGGPIPVDPAADPDTQKDQREQLRTRIEEK